MLPSLVHAQRRYGRTLALRQRLLQAFALGFTPREVELLEVDGVIWSLERRSQVVLGGLRLVHEDDVLTGRRVEASAWERHRISEALAGRVEAAWLRVA